MSRGNGPLVVVGGGLTGLVAARELALLETSREHRGAGAPREVVVLEASDRLGGAILTAKLGGLPLDLGPDAFLTADPLLVTLCDELGCRDELVAPAATKAAVFGRAALHPLPAGHELGVPTDLRALWRSGILRPDELARTALDLVLPGQSARVGPMGRGARAGEAGREGGRALLDRSDPTVAEVLGPRLGRALLDRLVDPLIGGINAGSVDELSFASTVPRLAAALARSAPGGDPSIIRTLRRARQARERHNVTHAAGGEQATARPAFLGLRGGTSRLIEALVADLERRGVTLHRSCAVRRLEIEPAGVELSSDAGPIHAAGVVLALPAPLAAPIVAGATGATGLARELARIPYASVAVLGMAYPAEHVRDVEGSGVLVPRAEGGLVTAATFSSAKWPRNARPDRVVLRAFVGRYGEDRIESFSDDALVAAVRRDLARLLKITAAPDEHVVRRWPVALPQYLPGHAELVRRLHERAAALGPVALAGASYEGLGLPACAGSGRKAARRLMSIERDGT